MGAATVAQRVKTMLIDDFDGTEIQDGGQTVQFALDGVSYEVDLSTDNAAKLREAFVLYEDKGRRVGGGQRRSSSRGRRLATPELQKMREWARQNGYQVSDRGRVPQAVQEAYHAAG